ncbi:Serine racemase [Bienertia sinuspersici]
MQSKQSTTAKVQQDTSTVHGRIMSEQETTLLELLEQFANINTIIAPISDGGLVSGVALAAKFVKPSIRLLAVEPIGAIRLATTLSDSFQENLLRRAFKDIVAEGIPDEFGVGGTSTESLVSPHSSAEATTEE